GLVALIIRIRSSFFNTLIYTNYFTLSILFSCLNFRFTQKNKKNKLSIEQMKKDIETDLKNDHKERRKIEEYTSLMEKCKATDAIFSFLRKSDEIITREMVLLQSFKSTIK
ncbi:hypothetical protein ABXM80_13800, partial [Enterococcus faecium]